jgi:RHS repeat-associated protein
MTGLDYAINRYYSNAYGRFMSPDPYSATGGPADPESWNRYSYTRGDPINRFDPVGLDDQCVQCIIYGPPPPPPISSGPPPPFISSFPDLYGSDPNNINTNGEILAHLGTGASGLQSRLAQAQAALNAIAEGEISQDCKDLFKKLGIDISAAAGAVQLYGSNDLALKSITTYQWDPLQFKDLGGGTPTMWDYMNSAGSGYGTGSFFQDAIIINVEAGNPPGVSTSGLVFHELMHTLLPFATLDHSQWGDVLGYTVQPGQSPNDALNQFLRSKGCIQ